MFNLSGPPRLGQTGFVSSLLAGEQSRCEIEIVPQAEVATGAQGREVVIRQPYQVRATLVWPWLEAETARRIQDICRGEFFATLRTIAAGDPSYATELELQYIATSPLKMTEDVSRRGPDSMGGPVRFLLTLEMESVRRDITTTELGLDRSGYQQTAEGADFFSLEPFGPDASIMDGGTRTVTLPALLGGTTYNIPVWTFGGDRVAAQDIQDKGDYFDITTRTP